MARVCSARFSARDFGGMGTSCHIPRAVLLLLAARRAILAKQRAMLSFPSSGGTMSQLHVVVGAGPVGRATALELAAAGHEVLLVSRSGSGPDLPGVRREAADAADADPPTPPAAGAPAVYNRGHPPGHTGWP